MWRRPKKNTAAMMITAHTTPTTIPAIAPPDKDDPEEEREDVEGGTVEDLGELDRVAEARMLVEIEGLAVTCPWTKTSPP